MSGSLEEVVPQSDDLVGAGRLQDLNGSQTNGAGAGDNDIVTKLEIRRTDTV